MAGFVLFLRETAICVLRNVAFLRMLRALGVLYNLRFFGSIFFLVLLCLSAFLTFRNILVQCTRIFEDLIVVRIG